MRADRLPVPTEDCVSRMYEITKTVRLVCLYANEHTVLCVSTEQRMLEELMQIG